MSEFIQVTSLFKVKKRIPGAWRLQVLNEAHPTSVIHVPRVHKSYSEALKEQVDTLETGDVIRAIVRREAEQPANWRFQSISTDSNYHSQ